MKTVHAINISPVKSMRLMHPATVDVGPQGVLDDRRLYLIDQEGKLLTQREVSQLTMVEAEYQTDPERLRLAFPNGASLEGSLDLGEPVSTRFWWRDVPGRVVEGDWNGALSEFCQRPVKLVKSDVPGACQDEYPISIMSQASIQKLSEQPGATSTVDYRRFRPSFLLAGCEVHEEDTWLDGEIRVGEQLRLKMVARDPRCVLTTQNPDTGERDLDTVRMILNYRPNPKAAYFGVYGTVEDPGTVSLGDSVESLGPV